MAPLLSALPNDPSLLAIIGLFGVLLAALLTALIQPIWTNYISPKSRLHVKITPHYFKIPKFLKDGIQDYRYNYKLNIRPTEEYKKKLYEISTANGHYSVSIENKSKTSIGGLNMRISDGREFFGDIEGLDQDTHFGKIMNLGSIDPESTVTLHIWTPSDSSCSAWSDPSEAIIVRAAAYDRLNTEVIIVGYVRAKNFVLSKKPFFRLGIVIWIVIVLMPVAIGLLNLLESGAETPASATESSISK